MSKHKPAHMVPMAGLYPQPPQQPAPTMDEIEDKLSALINRKIHPRFDLVLLERIPEYTTGGKVIIPESVNAKSEYFKVIEVGPGRVDEHGNLIANPLVLKPGDKVYARLGMDTSIPFKEKNGRVLWLVQNLQILATFEDNSNDEISETFEAAVNSDQS